MAHHRQLDASDLWAGRPDPYRAPDCGEVFARVGAMAHEDYLPGGPAGDDWHKAYMIQVPAPDPAPPEVVAAETALAEVEARLAPDVIATRRDEALMTGDSAAFAQAVMAAESRADLLAQAQVRVYEAVAAHGEHYATEVRKIAVEAADRQRRLVERTALDVAEARKYATMAGYAQGQADEAERLGAEARGEANRLRSPEGRRRFAARVKADDARARYLAEHPPSPPPMPLIATVRGGRIVAINGVSAGQR